MDLLFDTQKSEQKARHINSYSTLKIILWHILQFVFQIMCQNYFYAKKLTLTYLRKTLINQG